MPPKKRLSVNSPHPKRWRWKNGAWRYQVPKGQEHHWDGKTEFKLGKTEAEAYSTWAKRMGTYEAGGMKYMEQAADKYTIEVLPTKAPATQKSNRYSLQRIRQAFEGVEIAAIHPHHIYEYRAAVAAGKSEKHYNLDHEVLSHLFTKCIEWGVRHDHPMTGKKVVKFTTKKRDRYVEDWELAEFLSAASPFLNAYCSIKGLLGQDKSDLLSIQMPAKGDEGLTLASRNKNKSKGTNTRRRFFPYCDAEGNSTGLKEAVDTLLALPRPVSSVYLFCTRKGQPYIKPDGTTSGFDSIWSRAMHKALKETRLETKFTEHDLRAKVASDLETDEQAQRQLDHTTQKMTRTYRRKAVLMPVAPGFKKS